MIALHCVSFALTSPLILVDTKDWNESFRRYLVFLQNRGGSRGGSRSEFKNPHIFFCKCYCNATI